MENGNRSDKLCGLHAKKKKEIYVLKSGGQKKTTSGLHRGYRKRMSSPYFICSV